MKKQRIKVLYEDNHLIAVYKPAGTLVQGDETGDVTMADLVKEYIKEKFDKPGDVYLGVVHRLDRPVSGVTIFARTSKALTRMNKLFADREVEKTYMAVINERPNDRGEKLVNYILKDKVKNRVRVFDTQRYKDAKRAELSYEMLAELGGHFLLKVSPKTGRPHQIRAQLAKIGCPIRGDKKYGSVHHHRLGGIHLHSYGLSFIHPVKKEPVTITALPPNEQVWNMFKDYTHPEKKGRRK